MVVYCHSRNLVRALKELYEVTDVQSVVGWAIVRSKVSLEVVDVALGVNEEVVGDAGDVDATVGHASFSGRASVWWFLCSIVLPMNPPATPAIVASKSPHRIKIGQLVRVRRLRSGIGSSLYGLEGGTAWIIENGAVLSGTENLYAAISGSATCSGRSLCCALR